MTVFTAHKPLWAFLSLLVCLIFALINYWAQGAPVEKLASIEDWFDTLPRRVFRAVTASGRALVTVATFVALGIVLLVWHDQQKQPLSPTTTGSSPTQTAAAPKPSPAPNVRPTISAARQAAIVFPALLASTRARYGLRTPLIRATTLDAVATSRLAQLRAAGRVSGAAPKSSVPGSVGELMAWSRGRTPAATVAYFLNSRAERAVLLDVDWRSFGVAVVVLKLWGGRTNVTLTVIEFAGV